MRQLSMSRTRLGAFVVAPALACTLGGCATNASNPTLTLTDARMVNDERAALSVMIDNQSSYDFRVESVDWELIHGPLPVAAGTWEFGGEEDVLPSGEAMTFTRIVDVRPSIEPEADMQLTGQVNLEDQSNTGATAMTTASFSTTAAVDDF